MDRIEHDTYDRVDAKDIESRVEMNRVNTFQRVENHKRI